MSHSSGELGQKNSWVLLLSIMGSHRRFAGRGKLYKRGVSESSGGGRMRWGREHGVEPRPEVIQARAKTAATLERKEEKKNSWGQES